MQRVISYDDWVAEGDRLFGTNAMQWRFVCPACGHVATVEDWKNAGADESAVAFSCVGRWVGANRDAFGQKSEKGPCNYAGGGLFRLNPVTVVKDGKSHEVFDFDWGI